MSRAVSSPSSSSRTDLRSSNSEIAVWCFLCIVTTIWALIEASAASRHGQSGFAALWGALAASTLALLAWRAAGGELAPYLSSLLALALAAVHVGESLTGHYAFVDSDLAAAIFLSAAFVYRGPSRMWWRVFMPLSFVILFLPVAVFESRGDVTSSSLIRLALLPFLSLLVGALCSIVRETRIDSIDAGSDLKVLGAKSRGLVTEMKLMEKEMKVLMTMMKPTRAQSVTLIDSPWKSIPVSEPVTGPVNEPPFLHGPSRYESEPSRVISYADVQSLVQARIDRLRTTLLSRSGVQFTLTEAASALPLALRADRASIGLVISALLENAVEGLGGGDGLIRVTLRATLTHLILMVEDNGRGLSEAVMNQRRIQTERLADRVLSRSDDHLEETFASLTLARTIVADWGGDLGYHARLGVGARAELELIRVDGFAQGLLLRERNTRANVANTNNQ